MEGIADRGKGDIRLQDILRVRATRNSGTIICYPPGNTTTYQSLSYSELYIQAAKYSRILRALSNFDNGKPILLHIDGHRDNIIWFWAILLADGLPVLSSPFSNVEEHRRQHIRGLAKLLESPICITRNRLLPLFDGVQQLLQLYTVESLCDNDQVHPAWRESISQAGGVSESGRERQTRSLSCRGHPSLAMLMLTSGSTGDAKAVRLSHRQVIAAISGKAGVRQLHRNASFLNWIGLDHVASLVEIHIQALWLSQDQIHVDAADIVSSPKTFLDLLSQHRVCRTFAPNFFLARLVSAVPLESTPGQRAGRPWDLSSLQIVASGGEANDVKTCTAASSLFQRYGACRNVITPGFGMTETCAGAIFNLTCPDYDVEQDHDIACLGKGMHGIEMRVVIGSTVAVPNQPGDLEVRGDVVFDGYYRNSAATMKAFPSQNGWFRTGDQACIDSQGNLCLLGRKEEVINVNGIKIVTADLVSQLEKEFGEKVNRFVVFPTRAAHTEQITIAYVPKAWPHTTEATAEIEELAISACLASVSARPLVFSLSETSVPLLPTSTLGKISRAKMSSLFDKDIFKEDVAMHRDKLERHRRQGNENSCAQVIATKAEVMLMDDFAATLGISRAMIEPETPVFELGFTSMDLIRLKRRIDQRLGWSVPIITILKNPTARRLAAALNLTSCPRESRDHQPEHTVAAYDPVVTLQSSGKKTPLWLIHPGVGEVLVFVGLAQHLSKDDRRVYALRARGFEPGHERFSSITETVDTYVEAIRRRQPHGPYALAGYSYGTMLAFEVAKRLDALEDGVRASSVRFLGSFNLPPHIKSRMRELRWNMCLLHLTQFLDLMTEEAVEDLGQQADFVAAPRNEALAQILRLTDRNRMEALGLGEAALARWVNVAYGLQSMAVEYDPTGQVDSIDVFHAIPLRQAAATREEWVSEHLIKWREFSRTEPVFHAVGGAHYTMIGPEHVAGFATKLKEALRARGL